MERAEAAAAPGTTRFARRGAARLAYEAAGGRESERLAVVLLHDLLGDRSTLRPLRDALAAQGRRVIVPDLRGHGASAALHERPFTVPGLVGDALAVLAAEGVERAHVVGYGLGGTIALALGAGRRERVGALVVIEPALPGIVAEDADAAARGESAQARAAMRATATAADKGLIDQALDAYLERRWGGGWRDLVARARLGAIRRHASALGPLLPAVEGTVLERDELKAITGPVLILRGEEAPLLDRLVADRLSSVLPTVRLVMVPEGGHDLLGGEAGPAVVREVVAFLGEAAG